MPFMLAVIMLNVIMLNVIMLSVVAPFQITQFTDYFQKLLKVLSLAWHGGGKM
jgi:hypothetical protein